ncbi:MAG: hypothetical protein GYA63_07815 [Armatimonadetes bacterium]|jgi:hypothetical protein|nr:hypothetical protein [Armatimonadota bacterium]
MQHASWTVGILLALLAGLILYAIFTARRGKRLFIRRIPGLNAIDEAVGRAAEMGRPMLFATGLSGLDINGLQALAVAGHVARVAARYATRLILCVADPQLYAIGEETVRDAYQRAGRPELFVPEDVRFLSDQQFAFATAASGVMFREKVSSNFFFGYYYAEALILSEAGQSIGAMQVAGTPATTQLPFFVVSCDYTIMGEEYYATTAYLTREPTLLGSVVGQDWGKIIILLLIVFSTLALSVAPNANWVKYWVNLFPAG